MNCVRCGSASTLKAENYEGVEIDRCSRCHGVWLDDRELAKIVGKVDKRFPHDLLQKTIQGAFAGITEEEEKSLEHCPKCSAPLHPLNYNYSSGVIIDRCPSGHGIWLDKLELEKIQAHTEEWNKRRVEQNDKWLKLVEAARDNHLSEQLEKEKKNGTSLIAGILGGLGEWLEKI